MVFDDSRDMVEVTRQSMEFFAEESCGKCFPCRIGTQRLVERLGGHGGHRPAGPGTVDAWVDEVVDLNEVMKRTSACGLGQAAPLLTESLIRYFPDRIREHVAQGGGRPRAISKRLKTMKRNGSPSANGTGVRLTLTLDGEKIGFDRGETIYEVAERHRREIPTLCYDPRLEPFGGCRLCVVELEGARNPVASCTTLAEPGMRGAHPHGGARGSAPHPHGDGGVGEPRHWTSTPCTATRARRWRSCSTATTPTPGASRGRKSGESRPDDDNPFIKRDYDNCISCYRCVRVCAEQEGDYAISVMNRGFDTQITTEFGGLLKDSACTFCGQCIQTCPTGALGDLKALAHKDVPGETEKTRTICPYCGVGCSVDVMTRGDKIVGVLPAMDGPANEGALCVKGQFAFDFVGHPDRLAQDPICPRGEVGAAPARVLGRGAGLRGREVAQGGGGARPPLSLRDRLRTRAPRGGLHDAALHPGGTGDEPHRQLQPCLTRSHSRRSGGNDRTGRHVEPARRHGQARCDLLHRHQHDRVPPRRGHAAQAGAWRGARR